MLTEKDSWTERGIAGGAAAALRSAVLRALAVRFEPTDETFRAIAERLRTIVEVRDVDGLRDLHRSAVTASSLERFMDTVPDRPKAARPARDTLSQVEEWDYSYPRTEAQRIMARVERDQVREGWTWGARAAAKEAVMDVLEARSGSVPFSLRARLYAITDLEWLEEIHCAALGAESSELLGWGAWIDDLDEAPIYRTYFPFW